MLGADRSMAQGHQKEESVDELLEKLAKKGKKIKVLDEDGNQ